MKRFVLTLVMLTALATPAAAQTQPPTPTPTPTPKPPSSQDEFVPVNAPINPSEAIPAPRLVATAYGFIWIVLFGYLWSVRSRLGRVEREMDSLRQRVGRH